MALISKVYERFKLGGLWLLINLHTTRHTLYPALLKIYATLMKKWKNPKEFISLEDLHVLAAHSKINTVFS